MFLLPHAFLVIAGLTKEQMLELPTQDASVLLGETCMVCKDEFKPTERIKCLPCGHNQFHV